MEEKLLRKLKVRKSRLSCVKTATVSIRLSSWTLQCLFLMDLKLLGKSESMKKLTNKGKHTLLV